MKTRSMLGLSLGVCILFAGPAAIADQSNGKALGKSAPGVQVHIDKRTGKKTAPDDSALADVAATKTVDNLEVVAATVGVPVEGQQPRYNADGSMSAKVGLRDLQFATVTIGEDGEKTFSHRPVDAPAELAEDATHRAGEE